MQTIHSYNDLLNESEVDDFNSHSDLVGLFLDFLKVQDELPDYTIDPDSNFIMTFENDGYSYKIIGYAENGRVRIKSASRTGGIDGDLEYDLSSNEFETQLTTRDIYPKSVNKIARILKRDEM